ncbi:alkaline phosphatase [Coraliomargarita sp. SDUM461003]|uniref:Alkaline phosphatase n=1 Tax=Thalassobacterium maritimum TaxID=3041265 RepID=A0ABU1AYD1_9BACT|nr:alkaline phosphatase [Coraliomargarita sp. SDUM461003]MDQ8209118.1 alkaline phosphatase [Coraliomargarita sp. SDUM461003]
MENVTPSSRRQFLKMSGLAGAASLLTGSATASGNHPDKLPKVAGQAKNVIFLVVDGLSNGTVGLAHHWKLRHQQQPLNWIQLFERKDIHRAYQDTASASSPVTDSSAAASSWGCGQRINNGAVNVTPGGESLKPILSYAKEAGKATGLVTTCRVTHATPAGFAANVAKRNMEDEIAQQYFERGIDVILGGGARHFTQKQEDGSVNKLIPQFKDQGYTYVKNGSELAAAAKGQGPLLGLFANSHIPYMIDRESDGVEPDTPGLIDMFRAALARLDRAENGFLLQVEAGRVDHAGHANDAGAILREFLEFDACIPVALEYIDAHPDTMLVITTDHGTGGCQLNGAGVSYNDSGPALEQINQIKYSFEWLHQRLMEAQQFEPKYVKMAFGIDATADQAAIVQRAIDSQAKYLSGAFIEAFGPQIKEMTAVGWTSSKHTAECVELFAFGPGSETVPAFVKNYEIFGIINNTLGIQTS